MNSTSLPKKDNTILTSSLELSTLKGIIDAFAKVQGIGAGVFDTDYQRITAPSNHSDFCRLIRSAEKNNKALGDEACEACDRKHFPEKGKTVGPYQCHAGIVDFSVPLITSSNVLIGAIFGGQVLDHELTKKNFRHFRGIARRYGVDELSLFEAACQLPVMTEDGLAAVIDLCEGIATTITELVVGEAREHDFLLKLTSTLDLQALTMYVVEYVQTTLKADSCSIFLVEPRENRDVLVLRQTSSPHLKGDIGTAYYLPGEGLTGWLMTSGGRALNIADIHDSAALRAIDPKLQWHAKYPEIKPAKHARCYLGVPLVSEEHVKREVVGAIRASRTSRKRQSPFTETNALTMRGLARLIVSALESARAREREARHIKTLEALSHATRSLSSDLGLSEMLDVIIESGLAVMGLTGEKLSLYVLEHIPDDHQFVILAGGGAGFERRYIGERFPDTDGIAAHILKTGQYYISPNVSTDPYYAPIIDNMRSALVVPIYARERITGCLSLLSSRLCAFSPDDADLLQRFADHVSIALRNVHLFDRTLGQVEVLNRCVTAMKDGSDITGIAQVIVDVARARLNAVAASLFLLHEDERLHLAASTDDGLMKRKEHEDVYYEVGEGLTGGVAKAGRVLRIPQVSSADEVSSREPWLQWKNKFPEALPPNAKWKAFLGAPVPFAGDLLGVLRLAQRRDSKTFLPEDEELVKGIARHAGIALQFARTLSSKEMAIRGFAHDAGGPVQSLFQDFRRFYDSAPAETQTKLARVYALVEHITYLADTYAVIGRDDVIRHLRYSQCCPASMVDRILRIAIGPYGEKAATCSLRNLIPADLRVCADEGKLYTILFNLASNAARACVNDISVKCVIKKKEWEFQVTDDGPGIEAITIPREASHGRLGLYIAAKFAEAHGGSLHLSRHKAGPSRGTIATVLIPRSKEM